MRLELAEFPVSKIVRGKRFHYQAGTLEVDREALTQDLLKDSRIQDARVAVAYPGEKVRITGIRDVVEPRVKVEGKGQVFPGVLGPVASVGDGKTHRLSGMAVVTTAEFEGMVRAGTGVQRSGILDMWGPGAEISRYSSLVNLVLVLRLAHGLPDLEAHTAVQKAEFAVARRLAEATLGQEPRKVETYELKKKAGLPTVVLIQGCLTESHQFHSGVAYYGLSIRESLATFAHPNELFDGAVTVNTTRGIGYFPNSWDWQNHALVMGLYRQHATEINFAGVILERIRYETFHGKEVAAHGAAQLAQALGADGAVVTWLGSGNAFVDVMLTVRACERRGIKTVLVTYEYGGKDGIDSPLLYYVPEAQAVVSTGSRDRWVELPAPQSVIGPYEQIRVLSYPGAPLTPANGPLTFDAHDMLIGGVDNWGRQPWTCKAY